MSLREILLEVSSQLSAEFRKSARVKHRGGRGVAREHAVAAFLREYLPSKYAVGSGEVMSPSGLVSAELDVLLYDSTQCPQLLRSEEHAIFPVESIYGAISVKSSLASSDLAEAYANIRSLLEVVPRTGFTQDGVIQVGYNAPVPYTAVFAYTAGRSLDAIALQVASLDEGLDDQWMRPDYVVVLDAGIIGPRHCIRGRRNSYPIDKIDQLAAMRPTGRHTLLRFYVRLVEELNSITLRPLFLEAYLRAPQHVGRHRVNGHVILQGRVDSRNDPNGSNVMRLTEKAIKKILAWCDGVSPTPYGVHLLNSVGQLPAGFTDNYPPVVEYNPEGHPPLLTVGITYDERGSPVPRGEAYQPMYITIDDVVYAVDAKVFEDTDFVRDELFDYDEFAADLNWTIDPKANQ